MSGGLDDTAELGTTGPAADSQEEILRLGPLELLEYYDLGLSWPGLASSPPNPINQPCQRLVVVASIEAPLTLLQEPVEVIRPDSVASARAPLGLSKSFPSR